VLSVDMDSVLSVLSVLSVDMVSGSYLLLF
jgi:hypothetical protein